MNSELDHILHRITRRFTQRRRRHDDLARIEALLLEQRAMLEVIQQQMMQVLRRSPRHLSD